MNKLRGDGRRLYATTEEAASHFGITPDAVRWRLRAGRLRGRRLRGRWAVLRSELTKEET